MTTERESRVVHLDRAGAPAPAEPIRWPDGRRSAAALTFDLDAESAVLAIDPGAATRMSVMTHQAYGPLTGLPRLLAILRRRELRATFFVPGYTAERYPDTVRAIVEHGHEVAHHGYLHESPAGLTRDAEARTLDRALDALDRVAGVRPVGYRAPFWELNHHTPALLIERGFGYDSSLMDSDLPYPLADLTEPPRQIVEIPVHWGLDDWEQYAYLPGITGGGAIASPAKVLEMWTLELQAMHDDGGCFVLTTHPFLSGRPGRARMLDRLIETMQATPGLWLAPLSEIAAHVRTLDLAPRQFLPPAP